MLACIGYALARGAIHGQSLMSEPVSIFCMSLIFVSLCTVFIPPLFKWDWQAKYFGVISFQISSVALLALVPLFCFVLYGAPPIAIRAAIFLLYVGVNVYWCVRFVIYYRGLMNNPAFAKVMYEAEVDGTYFMQKGEERIFTNQMKFKIYPSNILFLLCGAAAFATVPFISLVTKASGLPYTHIFLLILGLPISMFGLGIGTRGWLIYIYNPILIAKATGKPVFVDMTGVPTH